MYDREVLNEYRTSDPIHLNRSELSQLQTSEANIQITPTNTDSYYLLRPTSHVGLIQIGDRTFEIQPKMEMSSALFLIAYTIDKVNWRELMASLNTEDNFLEMLAFVFARHTSETLRRGVLYGYQQRQEALNTVRGRINIGEQIRRRFSSVLPIELIYDDFTVDIEENRIIKAALAGLRGVHIRSDITRQRLRSLEFMLQDVSNAQYGRPPEISFNRLNDHYKTPVALARTILLNTSYQFSAGHSPIHTFLIDMNKVFEDFVVTSLRESLGLSDMTLKQGEPLKLDVRKRITLEPDISWWENNECLLVGDAKYKRTASGDGSNPDLYQLLAYTVASNLDVGTLIYAKGEAEPRVHEINYAGKSLIIKSLDLEEPPDLILSQIKAIGEQFKAQKNTPKGMAENLSVA